ncbi:MAG: cell division protein ZapE [Actinomycetota bacterium]
MPGRLSERDPRPAPDRLLADLVPPPRFDHVRFDTYRPDPAYPSQEAAIRRMTHAAEVRAARPRRWPLRPAQREVSGVYLDGGFGVGKTHLLASLWHAAHAAEPGCAAFGTFVEYTNLVGALGFAAAIRALSAYQLVCLDEFELDDPGDTVLMSTLLTRLTDAGVRLAATSNTLPDSLGEGRFAAEDFFREIQTLAQRFEVVRIDGEDYRHRGGPVAPEPWDDHAVYENVARTPGGTCDDFDALCALLARVHPSRYGALLDGVSTVGLIRLRPLTDQATALRFVVLVDRLYDRRITVRASGVGVDQLFPPTFLTGGYRKKYFRALSRLVSALA